MSKILKAPTWSPSRDDIALMTVQIATRPPIRIHKRLDWRKRSIKINEIELGHYIQNETHWEYLMLLAVAKPKIVAMASRDDGVISGDHIISNRAKAQNCRRELGRALPKGVLRLFIKAVPGLGHKLAHDVIVKSASEAGLQFYERPEKFEKANERSLNCYSEVDESIDGEGEYNDTDYNSNAS